MLLQGKEALFLPACTLTVKGCRAFKTHPERTLPAPASFFSMDRDTESIWVWVLMAEQEAMGRLQGICLDFSIVLIVWRNELSWISLFGASP